MMRCFPAATTRSIVRPRSGVWSSTRSSLGRAVSNLVTTFPASAFCSVAAVRKMVSPSGNARPHLVAHRRRRESRLREKRRQRRFRRRLVIDLGHEQGPPPAALDDACEALGDLARDERTPRLILGEK